MATRASSRWYSIKAVIRCLTPNNAGYLVLEDFAAPGEIAKLKARAEEIIEAHDVSNPSVFSTVNQVRQMLAGCGARSYEFLLGRTVHSLRRLAGQISHQFFEVGSVFGDRNSGQTTSFWTRPAASAYSWRKRRWTRTTI